MPAMQPGWRFAALLAGACLAACSLQAPVHTPLPAVPTQWGSAAAEASALPSAPAAWWTALHDSALDALIAAAEGDAPTLAQASARVEQARAALAVAQAGGRPQAGASLQASRGTSSAGLPPPIQNQTTAALSPSWEIDLFGRLRHDQAAAQARLDARQADARLATLSLQAGIADTLLQRRACALTEARQRETVESGETTLRLTRTRVAAGFAAPLDEARSRTSVGEARTALVATAGQCRQLTQVLADLSGLAAAAVDALLAAGEGAAEAPLPAAPALRLAVPAEVLAAHPALLAAQRAADAAAEDVGTARAARLPSLNLAMLLASSWIQVGRLDTNVNAWSLGATLAGPLYDGGSGAARVAGAEARYQEAVAVLRQTLRDTVRDVELALVAGDTASQSERQAQATLAAAQDLFRASEAAQQAGRLSVFDLEIARSALLAAQGTLIAAQRDRARAWVALVKATANPQPAAGAAGAPAGAAP